MASLGGRMTTRKGQAKQPVFEDYQPSVEWNQDPESYLLRVDLPGFKKEELKVQVDNSRKLTVKGRRQEGEGRFVCFEKAFDVPRDTIIEKINGKFEDGCLFLIMPKMPEEPKQEACTGTEASQDKKEDSSTPKENPDVSEKKEEDSTSKEMQQVAEEKKKEENPIMKEKPRNAEKKEDQDTIHGNKSQEKEGSEGPIHEEKHEHGESVKKKMKKAETSWEEYIGGDDGHFEENKKKGVAKRKRKEKEEQGWLDCGLVDDFFEKINQNRKAIAVAFVAFSVGFYVSHKLRQRG